MERASPMLLAMPFSQRMPLGVYCVAARTVISACSGWAVAMLMRSGCSSRSIVSKSV